MDIFRLETFCKVYELKSFSKAARELFISQPTVSSHILSLEKELGGNLFDRIGRNILPTPAGDVLYKYAKEVIQLINYAISEVQLLRENIVGNLRLGGSTIPGTYILPSIISQYSTKYPNVRIYLDIADSLIILNKVLKGDIDLAIVGTGPKNVELESISILEDELVFVGKKNFFRNINKLEDIVKLPWIIREKGSGTRKAVEQGFIDVGLSIDALNMKICVSNSQGLLNLVKQGVGISITSMFAARELLHDPEMEVKRFPFFSFKRNFVLVYRKARTLFPASVVFKEFVMNFCSKIKLSLKEGDSYV